MDLPGKTEQEIAEAVQKRAKELTPQVEKVAPSKEYIKECLDSNERGDGALFASIHGDQFLVNTTQNEFDEWYTWSGNVWEVDHKKRSVAAVEDVALCYLNNMSDLQQEIKEKGIDKKSKESWKIKLRDKYKSRVDKMRSGSGQKAVLTQAPIVHPSMMCQEHDFDKNPWLLPVKNGVINLKTGVLEQGRPSDLLRKSLDIDYNPHADHTFFENFILEICGSQEVADFIRRSFGYAMTGNSFEQFIWVFIGPGRNGKGKMFGSIADVMGPYYHEISRGMLLEQRTEPSPAAASEHKYSLLSKRIIVGAETNKGQRIDEGAVKSLTGENKITCRPNFKSEIRFDPTHTLFLETNNIPFGLTKSFAIKQRLLIIDFPYMYVEDVELEKKKYPAMSEKFRKKDPKLGDKLRECRKGILRWMVKGCLEWQQIGISPPQSILNAVNELAAKEDDIGRFITDCLTHYPDASPDDPKYRISCTSMYEAFRWWCSENVNVNEKKIPAMKTVNSSLRDRGHIVDQIGGKTWIYKHTLNPKIIEYVQTFINKGEKYP